ncbi:type I secretion system permease/ATPase [Methylophilus medardicus]|uniref:Cyclolysin secretion/processing ATP-binding protein CyaB n=1 Tax=Methylophilus medardicus TaxID=2588534 RepID=A0A5B8CSW7_9PROT|nr:type I secretion system permease/ATPase [Methylophilus medardicus]QDC44388.1 type I secretion system permease/ATPase [Methylophilus medardicus]QDC49395.1 type I secretion system permease/ATPase [Methylophilus medardicus]QDC53100.1 type I secretion system permease/ATPase [Methylophilus medardicus]
METTQYFNKSSQDALLECLLYICRHNRLATTRDALTSGLPLDNGKLNPELFKRSAERLRLEVTVKQAAMTELLRPQTDITLLLNHERACQLLNIDDTRHFAQVVFADISPDPITMSLADLAAEYTGYALVTKQTFIFDKRTPEVGRIKARHWFWGTLAENKGIYRDVMLAALLINLFALAMPLFTMNVYDRVVPNKAIETLWVLGIGVGLIVLGDLLLRSMRAYFLDWASARIDVKLSAQIMEKVLGTRYEAKPNSVGSFASNLRSFESVRDFITSATVITLIDLPFGIIFLIVIAWINVYMVLPALIGGAIVLIYSLSVQTKMHDLSETMYRASAQRNATLIESLVGLETVKSMGVEGQMQGKWEKSALFLSEVGSKLKLLSSSITNGSYALQQIISVVIVILGVYLISNGDLTMGGLIACSQLTSRGLAPISQIASLFTQYHTAATSLKSLEEIMAKPEERSKGVNFLSRPAFKGEIEFKNVSFKYPGSDELALNRVSFRIRPGEHVGLIGRMGSGKTTINKLILGLYQPSEGAILIDGIDARQIDPAELRRSVGYVQQDNHLFYGSLRENITLRDPHADDQSVLQAAKIGGIADYVNAHPKGFDLEVGERGDTLSGGQRQGVGIARAFVTQPQIVLLDEPTSAMDHSGEETVKRNIAEATSGKTMVVISHRNAMLELAERLIVIDSGQVVADGTKEDVTAALRAGKVGKAR